MEQKMMKKLQTIIRARMNISKMSDMKIIQDLKNILVFDLEVF